MKVTRFIFFIIISAFFLNWNVSIAQSQYQSVGEMTTGAEELFSQEKYIEAFPLYSQLLSLDNTNPELNYKFGVCLLYADRSDTYAPIKYLKKAMDHIDDVEIYYHLGFAYHINYYFPAAISHYTEYQNKAGKRAKKHFEVARKIEMCQNGMKMMRSVKDLFVLQKSEVSRNEFFRSYDLHDFGSRIIKKPEEFLNKEDKKRNENDFIFFNPNSKKIYYSAFSSENKKQKDIFIRNKSKDGLWENPQALSKVINTDYDEDFPVIMPDGKTLYFSSKGHTTIGGYDIFKSIYNEQSKTWSQPENINFPFNTPLDDILFVSDTLESTAWFASVRNTVQEKIMVYKVGIIKRPEGSTDLAAIYAKNKELTEEDLRQIKLRARLDVNISSEEYEEIPVEEEIEDPIAAAQELRNENLSNLQDDIIEKQKEQQVIDSAKALVNSLEKNIDIFDSVRQSAVSLASIKRLEAHRIKEDVKQNMKFTTQTSELETLQRITQESNISMAKAEKLEYEAGELDEFARGVKSLIVEQRSKFSQINQLYGDAEAAVVQGNRDDALVIIERMNVSLGELPQLPELQKDFDINNGGLQNIQYPTEIQNEEEFVAFVMNTDEISPSIQSFNSNYDEFIPALEEVIVEKDEALYSNNPSTKIEQYISELNNQASSLDIVIAEHQAEIDHVKNTFKDVPSEAREEQLDHLNILIEEQNINNQNLSIARSTASKLQSNFQNESLSVKTPDEKMAIYSEMATTASKVFDFNKKVFVQETAPVQAVVSLAAFVINDNGQLIEKTPEPKELVLSKDIQFNTENAQLIKTQMTEMLSEIRTANKQNSFAIKKVERNANKAEREALAAFAKGNELIFNAKGKRLSEKKRLVSQANEQFAIALQKNTLVKNLSSITLDMSQADIDSKEVISRISTNVDDVSTSVNTEDWGKTENIYSASENAFNNHKAIIDFSNHVNLETGELINNAPVENIAAYTITNDGELIKSFGNSSADWSQIDEFVTDVSSKDTKQNFVIASDFSFEPSHTGVIDSFSPTKDFSGDDIQMDHISIPEPISRSDNSLVKNTLRQIQGLKIISDQLISKRNIVNQYYKKTIEEAKVSEQIAINRLKNKVLKKEDIAYANQKSRESKISLFKAAQAASIINDFDIHIVEQANAITQGLSSADDILSLINENKQDDALLMNMQAQRKISEARSVKVDDSSFNYAVNEMFTDTPEELLSEENKSYSLINGKVTKNDLTSLNQLISVSSTNKAPAFTSTNLLVLSSAVLAVDQLSLALQQRNVAQNTDQNTELEAGNTSANSITSNTDGEQENTLRARDTIVIGQEGTINLSSQENIHTNTELSSNDEEENIPANTELVSNDIEENIPANTDLTSNDKEENIPANIGLASDDKEVNDSMGIQQASIVKIQSFSPENLNTKENFREALAALNSYSQTHMSEMILKSNALISLAETKLKLSNNKSIEAEQATDPRVKQALEKESKDYLYEALAVKDIAEKYQTSVQEEAEKQKGITETTFDIESQLEQNNIAGSKASFIAMQGKAKEFGDSGTDVLKGIEIGELSNEETLSRQVDSAYALSQSLANESVKLLSEASEERNVAEGKRNAFKRREHMKKAEMMGIRATDLQNQSEKALAFGNNLYQKKSRVSALANIKGEIDQIINNAAVAQDVIAKSDFVFDGIESRKVEVIDAPLSINTSDDNLVPNQKKSLIVDDLHAYERETYKAQMITEEMELIKREIALLVQTNKSNLSDREIYVLDNKINVLRGRTDSLEIQANKSFEFAKDIFSTLSTEEQKTAKAKGREFNDYLNELKDRIEILLSEASALKQRAQRSNNLVSRSELFDEAQEKERIAMYFILEEFEVIAQKNKTRYQKNQLILQQFLMESASLEERNLVANIFSQIESYFADAQRKRDKANSEGISYNMKKILLQDAYSLEMRGLDLQQQVKTMLENHDTQGMLALQSDDVKEDEIVAQNDKPATNNTSTTENTSQDITNDLAQETTEAVQEAANDIAQTRPNVQKANNEISFNEPANGTIYKVQFSAIQELKPASFFSRITEITAQKVPNTKFIRYFSGNFNRLDAAMIRRNSIRASGYSDAFIKSWKDGEEVSLLSLRDESSVSNVNLSAGTTSQAVINKIDFSATNISSLQGVYYSVQIGVYSRPRTSAMIHNIAPLYHKRMNNGYWIYYSGIYKSIADATSRKDEIIVKGVKDAFVVAFSDGQIVSFTQARQDLLAGNSEPNEEDIVILEDASLQIDSQWNISKASNTDFTPVEANMIYKIQIGVYSNPVNMSWINSQLDDGLVVSSFQNKNGKYVFTVGNFGTANEARTKLAAVKDIIADAFVVGFKEGTKVYVR